MVQEGKVNKGDNMDVDHIRPLIKGGSNDPDNLRIISRNLNRSFPRTKKAKMR